VQNDSQLPKLVDVKLKPKEAKAINLRYPRSGFKTKLNAGSCKILSLINKIEPAEADGAEAGLTEMDKLELLLKVKDDVDKIAKDTEIQGSNSHGGPTAPEPTSGTHDIGTGPADYAGFDPNDFGGSGETACPVCTFLNPSSNKECEMCQSKLD